MFPAALRDATHYRAEPSVDRSRTVTFIPSLRDEAKSVKGNGTADFQLSAIAALEKACSDHKPGEGWPTHQRVLIQTISQMRLHTTTRTYSGIQNAWIQPMLFRRSLPFRSAARGLRDVPGAGAWGI